MLVSDLTPTPILFAIFVFVLRIIKKLRKIVKKLKVISFRSFKLKV